MPNCLVKWCRWLLLKEAVDVSYLIQIFTVFGIFCCCYSLYSFRWFCSFFSFGVDRMYLSEWWSICWQDKQHHNLICLRFFFSYDREEKKTSRKCKRTRFKCSSIIIYAMTNFQMIFGELLFYRNDEILSK